MSRRTKIRGKITACRNCGCLFYAVGNGQPFCCEPCRKAYAHKIAEQIQKERKDK